VFLVTIIALSTAGIGSARLTLTSRSIATPLVLEVTSGRFASAQLRLQVSTFSFAVALEIDGTIASAAAANIPSDGGFHVQVIGMPRAVGHIVHDPTIIPTQALELSCLNDPSQKVTCPGSLRCTDSSGGDFTLTC
jgi:hypothetical protein